MLSRRNMLGGLAAAGLWPMRGWADVGGPAYLAAAKDSAGFALHGLTQTGESLFSLPLPTRGHAAAAHPTRAEAVAFARRPGTYAIVIDCLTGAVTTELTAPPGRHFYGHGTFSAKGDLLFTTENDFEAAEGMVGVWDATGGYRRLGEFSSGGTGPHELRLMPDGQTLAIANGGIETHPEAGRAKLNLPMMRPNLAYVRLDGEVLDVVTPPEAEHRNSMRHLAVDREGRVALALQWQGDAANAPALLMLHARGQAPMWLRAPDGEHEAMQGYAGSVAFSGDGRLVAITSPRGGRVQVFDAVTGAFQHSIALADVCGLAPAPVGLTASTGQGTLHDITGETPRLLRRHEVAWDNHLIPIAAA